MFINVEIFEFYLASIDHSHPHQSSFYLTPFLLFCCSLSVCLSLSTSLCLSFLFSFTQHGLTSCKKKLWLLHSLQKTNVSTLQKERTIKISTCLLTTCLIFPVLCGLPCLLLLLHFLLHVCRLLALANLITLIPKFLLPSDTRPIQILQYSSWLAMHLYFLSGEVRGLLGVMYLRTRVKTSFLL